MLARCLPVPFRLYQFLMLLLTKEVMDHWNGRRYPRVQELHLCKCKNIPTEITDMFNSLG